MPRSQQTRTNLTSARPALTHKTPPNPAGVSTKPINFSTRDSKLHVDVKKNDLHLVVEIKAPSTSTKRVNIFEAIKAKDFDSISLYVKAGGDVNVKSKEGYTPLMTAIQNKWSASEVKKMLDKMPNVDLKLFATTQYHSDTKYGKPIDMAIKFKDLDLFKVLLNYASTVSISKEFSCSFGDANEIPKYLKEVLPFLDFQDYKNAHQILMMTLNKHDDIFESTINRVKSIPDISNYQHALLSQAALANNNKAVDLLMDRNLIGKKAIEGTLYNLAQQDKVSMFKHISEKPIDHESAFKYLTSLKDHIPEYFKYSEILGFKQEEPGTIYISDVLDTTTKGDLNFKGPVKVDVKACNTVDCIHVQADLNAKIPQVVEGIVT